MRQRSDQQVAVVVGIAIEDHDRMLGALDDQILAVCRIGDAAADEAIRIGPRQELKLGLGRGLRRRASLAA